MAQPVDRLAPSDVLTTILPLLQRAVATTSTEPRCPWCHGPAVWTTGNKARCTRCGYVPS